MPPHLLTYPRSGSHYFDRLIYKQANFHIERSHIVNHLFDKNNKKVRRIITIARDPKESVASWLGLDKSLGNGSWPNEKVTEYILLYSFLYDNADYVIDFADLIQKPELVGKKILELLEIDKENSYRFVTDTDYDSKAYLDSSKSFGGYKDIVLDNLNIDLCYFYYNRLLEKKIII